MFVIWTYHNILCPDNFQTESCIIILCHRERRTLARMSSAKNLKIQMAVNEWNEVKEVILTTVGFYKTFKVSILSVHFDCQRDLWNFFIYIFSCSTITSFDFTTWSWLFPKLFKWQKHSHCKLFSSLNLDSFTCFGGFDVTGWLLFILSLVSIAFLYCFLDFLRN